MTVVSFVASSTSELQHRPLTSVCEVGSSPGKTTFGTRGFLLPLDRRRLHSSAAPLAGRATAQNIVEDSGDFEDGAIWHAGRVALEALEGGWL